MAIDALGSGSFDLSAFRHAADQFRSRATLSLLPTVPSTSSGLGLGGDIYDSVARQTQGLYTGGRTAMLSAYAALGIDVSEKAKQAVPAEETEEAETGAPEETAGAVEPEEEPRNRNITDKLLEESGYVKPEANPWQVRTDFFA